MNPTHCERYGEYLAERCPPGSVRYTYLIIKVTAPNGNAIYLERPHDKSGTWTLRATNRLGIPEQIGQRDNEQGTTKTVVHFAKTGELL